MPSTPNPPTTPIPSIMVTADDVRGDPDHFASLLNQIILNLTQAVNALGGAAGQISLNAPLDLQGNPILNVAAPTSPSHVLTVAAAEAAYSAPAIRPQLESTGKTPLQSYRQLSNPYQQERNSSWLNTLANTSPAANTSTVSFGAVSGGFVPVTVSSGIFTRADGSTLAYSQFNDSVAVPASFAIASIARASGVVTGSTTGVNTLQAGDTVQITGVTDSTYNGSFVLAFVGIGGSPPGPVFQFTQAGADSTSSGGTISLFGVYYYCINPAQGNIFRVGPYENDSAANRLNAQKDGSRIVAVALVTGSGGDTVNTAGGGTSPATNIGGNNRILSSV